MSKKMTALLRRHQFARYVLVGIGNTAFSYSLYAAFLWWGLAYPYASLLSLVLGILFSFFMQGRLVFGNTSRTRLTRFVLAWGLLYGLNILIITGLIQAALSAYLAGAIATLPVTLISYFVLKYAVFGGHKPPHTAPSTQ